MENQYVPKLAELTGLSYLATETAWSSLNGISRIVLGVLCDFVNPSILVVIIIGCMAVSLFGMDTAFCTSFRQGTGGSTIAFLGEFDVLSRLSQREDLILEEPVIPGGAMRKSRGFICWKLVSLCLMSSLPMMTCAAESNFLPALCETRELEYLGALTVATGISSAISVLGMKSIRPEQADSFSGTNLFIDDLFTLLSGSAAGLTGGIYGLGASFQVISCLPLIGAAINVLIFTEFAIASVTEKTAAPLLMAPQFRRYSVGIIRLFRAAP